MSASHTEMLHTPGPWSCAQIWRGPETKVHAEIEGRRVALAEVFTMHLAGEREANAHLIAAAPDLLAGAKAILAARDGKASMDAILRLRDAIAKAEGREVLTDEDVSKNTGKQA